MSASVLRYKMAVLQSNQTYDIFTFPKFQCKLNFAQVGIEYVIIYICLLVYSVYSVYTIRTLGYT